MLSNFRKKTIDLEKNQNQNLNQKKKNYNFSIVVKVISKTKAPLKSENFSFNYVGF